MNKEKSVILNREIISLTDSQNKMIASGWGEEVVENTTKKYEEALFMLTGKKVSD